MGFAKSERRLEYLDPLGRMGEGKTDRAPGPKYSVNTSTLVTKGISLVKTELPPSIGITAQY